MRHATIHSVGGWHQLRKLLLLLEELLLLTLELLERLLSQLLLDLLSSNLFLSLCNLPLLMLPKGEVREPKLLRLLRLFRRQLKELELVGF